ncbi:glycosyltransferase [Oxalobacteraceae bacterium CAVE-383]|nr:glycosyltransferase [Oxalobacteraceae bacterium CAVE-383]
MNSEKTISIAGFPVIATNSRLLATHLHQTIQMQGKETLFFANTNFIVKCRPLLERLKGNEGGDRAIIVNDGVGMDIAAMLAGERFSENLNGTDFTPYFLGGAARPLRVFLLGAKPEVVAMAARHVEERLGQTVAGTCDGYAGLAQCRARLPQIVNRSRADVLLVAMGNPVQEEWIMANRAELNAHVVIGVGALFDFWAGDKPRAPRLVQRARLEWLYRLCLEPRRLLRRYTVDIVRFLLLCRKYRGDGRA